MGKVTGFLEIDRHDRKYKPAADRIRHYREFVIPLSDETTRSQVVIATALAAKAALGIDS